MVKKREFNHNLKRIATDGKIDISKIKNLPDNIRSGMVYFIISRRQPVLKDLIPDGFDMSWMRCMGYLYETTVGEYTLLHSCVCMPSAIYNEVNK
jgi:hypothetical protein